MRFHVKRRVEKFILDESGSVDAKMVLRTGAMITSAAAAAAIAHAGGLIGIGGSNADVVCGGAGLPSENCYPASTSASSAIPAQAQTTPGTCPSCITGCGQPACHANCAALSNDAATYIGQHTHRIEQSASCPPPASGGGGGDDGWIFDCLGSVDDPKMNNNGNLMSFLLFNGAFNRGKTSFALDVYNAIGVVFTIAKIDGIRKDSWVEKFRDIWTPAHDLGHERGWYFFPLARGFAMQAYEVQQIVLADLAREGILARALAHYLDTMCFVPDADHWSADVCEKNLIDHVKRINHMVHILESVGAPVDHFLDHHNYVALQRIALRRSVKVSTPAKRCIGIRRADSFTPDLKLLSAQERSIYDLVGRVGLRRLYLIVSRHEFEKGIDGWTSSPDDGIYMPIRQASTLGSRSVLA